jgi:mono/diheme cytochrome c family protein
VQLITVLAVLAGITWLGILLVAALRNRGTEEVPPNLQPGFDDAYLETKRLEKGQKAAIAFSAFLTIALPLYFLTEPTRQEGFAEQFAHESVERGEEIVTEFGCFSCHGPLGAGGSATYVEPRTGVQVQWAAPRLDDIFYRNSEDEVIYWITYGRANTPMPAWGLAGGGAMNEHQIQDIVNYLKTIQRTQAEVANEMPARIQAELDRLANAEATVASAIISQRQVVAEIDQAPEDVAFIDPIVARVEELMAAAGAGLDTDGDGVADAVETELSQISLQVYEYFQAFAYTDLDPESPDQATLDANLAALRDASRRDPILEPYLDAIQAIVDGEGLTAESAPRINAQFAQAASATIPSGVNVISLDPTNAESVSGTSDFTTASQFLGALESVAINKRVLVENEGRIRPKEEAGLANLQQAARERRWEVDYEGIARAMGGTVEEAQRAVGLFNANCARCHTAGFSAGIAYTQEVGSGGFGPALWEGRPVVQFGEAPTDPTETDLLVDFILNGSEADKAYGLNGMGSGRMPGFGQILSQQDIELLARFLRGGDLNGKGGR